MVVLLRDLLSDLQRRVIKLPGDDNRLLPRTLLWAINQATAEWYKKEALLMEKMEGRYMGDPQLMVDEFVSFKPAPLNKFAIVGEISFSPLNLPNTNNGIEHVYAISEATGEYIPFRVAEAQSAVNIAFVQGRSMPQIWQDHLAVFTKRTLTLYNSEGIEGAWVRYYSIPIKNDMLLNNCATIPYPIPPEAWGEILDMAAARLLEVEKIPTDRYNDSRAADSKNERLNYSPES